MSDDVIRVPFRARGDSLADMAEAAQALPAGTDRDVARGLVLEAAESGMSTAGQVLDALEGMTVDARRRLLDRARARADVPTTTQAAAAAARRVSAPMINEDARDEIGRALQVCAEVGCKVFPIDPVTGGHVPHAAKVWWCAAHKHLAAPGDLEPWVQRIEFAPGGGLQFPDEVAHDIEVAEREAERRAAFLEERRAQRIKEWPALEAEDAAQAAALKGDNFKTPRGAQP
jgi:hypothetical protein